MAHLGIDLGGTYARAAVVEPNGHILSSARTALSDRTPEAVVESIAHAAHDALSVGGPVDSCGVGVAGMLDAERGVVINAPNLGWRDVPFGQMLADRLGRSVRLVNDLSAAAWGELKAGAGQGANDLFVVFVGSGVGSAIISAGRLLRGATGNAGEFGHVKVVPEGRLCGCGERGCLEAYAGGHNLIDQMRELVESGAPTILRERTGGDLSKLNPVLLEEAALAGDAGAKEIYDRACGYLGLAIANQVTVLNPKKLILGGGVLRRNLNMRKVIAGHVDRYALEVARAPLEIHQAALGDDSGLIGAALLGAAG